MIGPGGLAKGAKPPLNVRTCLNGILSREVLRARVPLCRSSQTEPPVSCPSELSSACKILRWGNGEIWIAGTVAVLTTPPPLHFTVKQALENKQGWLVCLFPCLGVRYERGCLCLPLRAVCLPLPGLLYLFFIMGLLLVPWLVCWGDPLVKYTWLSNKFFLLLSTPFLSFPCCLGSPCSLPSLPHARKCCSVCGFLAAWPSACSFLPPCQGRSVPCRGGLAQPSGSVSQRRSPPAPSLSPRRKSRSGTRNLLPP